MRNYYATNSGLTFCISRSTQNSDLIYMSIHFIYIWGFVYLLVLYTWCIVSCEAVVFTLGESWLAIIATNPALKAGHPGVLFILWLFVQGWVYRSSSLSSTCTLASTLYSIFMHSETDNFTRLTVSNYIISTMCNTLHKHYATTYTAVITLLYKREPASR